MIVLKNKSLEEDSKAALQLPYLATLVNVACRNVNKDLDVPFDSLLGADGRESINPVLVDLLQE